MKQLEFESRHNHFWNSYEANLTNYDSNNADVASRFPHDYRAICQHLAIAKSRRYAPALTNRLNLLVQQGYQLLYGENIRTKGALLDFLFYGFPSVLRANAGYIWVSTIVFVLPTVLMLIACLVNDQMIYSLLDGASVRNFESMYDPDLRKFGRERQSDTDLMMFGHYIYNNIGISFKCFAMGIFAGIGSLFIVGFNGLFFGAVAGHLTALGYNETFYPFVIGHGSFELTAIVFSGAAGLKIGYSLISPGKYTRIRSLQLSASEAIKIIYGSTIMLVIAAFVEAFWSSSSVLPIMVKLVVGGFLWLLVMYYCFFFGKAKVNYATR